MRAEVPGESDLSGESRAIAYACLDAAIPFDVFFKHDREPLVFTDSRGRKTPVHAFGIREQDKHKLTEAREQVVVLYREKGEFAVDLSKSTKPYQIILARIGFRRTLRETLDYLEERISRSQPRHLNEAVVLLVPSMHWRVSNRFQELERPFVSLELRRIVLASQTIQFKIDRKGARAVSSAILAADNGHSTEPDPDYYLFDAPYLVVMKKRGGAEPFFVMGVDNAELMQRR